MANSFLGYPFAKVADAISLKLHTGGWRQVLLHEYQKHVGHIQKQNLPYSNSYKLTHSKCQKPCFVYGCKL